MLDLNALCAMTEEEAKAAIDAHAAATVAEMTEADLRDQHIKAYT